MSSADGTRATTEYVTRMRDRVTIPLSVPEICPDEHGGPDNRQACCFISSHRYPFWFLAPTW